MSHYKGKSSEKLKYVDEIFIKGQNFQSWLSKRVINIRRNLCTFHLTRS